MILILNKDLRAISTITDSRTLLSITFDEEVKANIGGEGYILQCDKNGGKLREVDLDGDIYKITYVNGLVMASCLAKRKIRLVQDTTLRSSPNRRS